MNNPEKWKVIGGGIIVAIAFAIMMPGVLDYVGRIGRVLLLVLIAVSIAFAVVFTRHKVVTAKKKPDLQTAGSPSGAVNSESDV